MTVLPSIILMIMCLISSLFFFQAEDGIRDGHVTGVQTCALPISARLPAPRCFQGHLRAAELSSYPEFVLLGSTPVPDHWAVGCAGAGRLRAGHALHRHPPSRARGGRCPRHLGGWVRARDAPGGHQDEG